MTSINSAAQLQRAVNLLMTGDEGNTAYTLQEFNDVLDYLYRKLTGLYIVSLEHGEQPDTTGSLSNNLYALERISDNVAKAIQVYNESYKNFHDEVMGEDDPTV